MSQPYVGEIRMFGGNFAPAGWMLCEGQLLPISEYETLFKLIGTTYGGDGQSTFGLPNLRVRLPIHMGWVRAVSEWRCRERDRYDESNTSPHSHGLGDNEREYCVPSLEAITWPRDPTSTTRTNPGPTLWPPQFHPSVEARRTVISNLICARISSFPFSEYSRVRVSQATRKKTNVATPFLSEIKIFSFGFAPKGCAFCNGQLLPINQNQAIPPTAATIFAAMV